MRKQLGGHSAEELHQHLLSLHQQTGSLVLSGEELEELRRLKFSGT